MWMSKDFYRRFVIFELNVGLVIYYFLTRSFFSNFSHNANPILVESGFLLIIFLKFSSKNTTLRLYYLLDWLTYLIAIFNTHLQMELLLNSLSLSFFISKIQENFETILSICYWKNLVPNKSYFLTFFSIETRFIWIHGILITIPPILFAIVDVFYLAFLCIQLCPLCLLDFSKACLLLKLTLCIWEIIDWNLFFVLFILFVVGWLGFLQVSLNFCYNHDLILRQKDLMCFF
jgi:hypothetical protein